MDSFNSMTKKGIVIPLKEKYTYSAIIKFVWHIYCSTFSIVCKYFKLLYIKNYL